MRYPYRVWAIVLICMSLIACSPKSNTDYSVSTEEPLSTIENADNENTFLQDDNPIDAAFAHAKTVLSQEETSSITFAYMYARQWYSEINNIFRTMHPRSPGVDLRSYRNYALRQIEITRIARNQQDTTFNYFIALGDFLRSEALRFKDIIREEGGDAGYLVEENILFEKLKDTQYHLTVSMHWSENSPLLLLAEVPEKSVYLYYAEPFGMILDIKGQYKLVEWPGLSPSMALPTMIVKDWDNDGEDEIIVAHNCKTGVGITYISAESLYVIEYDNKTGIVDRVSALEFEELSSFIRPDLKLQENADSFSFTYQDQAISLLKPSDMGADESGKYNISIGNLVLYDLNTEPVTVDIGIVIYTQKDRLIEVVPCVAEVVYTGEGYNKDFWVTNVQISQPKQ